MGHVTCGTHPGIRCCWRCDRCPKCNGIGRLRRGDYCAACTAFILRHGGRWNPTTKDYDGGEVPGRLFDPEDLPTVRP